jgi:hypothetical protein
MNSPASFVSFENYLSHPIPKLPELHMPSSYIIRMSFELTTIYSILLLFLYIFKRDATIPLTYRAPMYDWGALKKLIEARPVQLDQQSFRAALWCDGADTSPQCSCMYSYLSESPNSTYVSNANTFLAGKGPASTEKLAEKQYEDLIGECLSKRTSWRKETCEYWCKVHLVTPISLATLFTSLFFSRIVQYDSRLLQMIAGLLPMGIALVTIAAHIGIDLAGGVIASLSVLSAVLEVTMNSCPCVEDAHVYWNHLRFVAATLAVWVAATQQARDVYLITSYAVLGFILGLLAYTQYLMRYRQGCNTKVRVVSLYVWVGMCVISACLLLLVQQEFYPSSPVWSSLVAMLAMGITCIQCFVNAPGVYVSDTLQISVTTTVLSFATVAAAYDTLNL